MPTIMRSRTMASPLQPLLLSLPLLFLLLPYIHAKHFHSNLHRVGGRHGAAHHNRQARHGPVHHGPKYHTGQHHGAAHHGGGGHGHHGPPVHRTPSYGVAHHGGHPVHNAPNHGVAHHGDHEQHPVHNAPSHRVAHQGGHEQHPVHNAPNHGVAHQGGHELHPSHNTQNFHPEPAHGVEAHERHEFHNAVNNSPESHPGPVHEPERSKSGGQWKSAHATFYGGKDGSETMGGACGYQQGYGLQTAALSQVMFNNGQSCGACYEIRCVNSPQWCKPGQPSLFVTATNLCPPNYNIPSDNGGWCNPPREHFDLSQPAYLQIAEYKAGIVPVEYRRVPCKKEGGVRFTIKGNPYFTLVLVANVGGAGDITSVEVKGDKKVEWTPMKRNWGQNWETHTMLVGESLAFRVKLSDGKSLTSWHVTPESWQFGQTFEGKNFN